MRHNYIGTEHLLLGLLREQDGVAASTLKILGVSITDARARIRQIIGEGQAAPTGHIPFTPRAKKVLELALREALQLGHNYIGTEHILLGLIREGEGVASEVLQGLGVDLARGRQAVVQLLSGYVSEVESAEAEEVGAYVEVTAAPVVEAISDDAPTCPNCFGALDETLAVRVLAITTDDEPFSVKIAYCRRCGVALGAVS